MYELITFSLLRAVHSKIKSLADIVLSILII